ncbi:hypothetical protein PU01_22870 [Hafnia alvei]|nr:hypothetical protein PU01_22870 [Hafnia alvei]PNK70596.1 hypothetical protein A6J69_000340 [Hafnia paralvei]
MRQQERSLKLRGLLSYFFGSWLFKTGTFVMFDKNYVFINMTRAKGDPLKPGADAPQTQPT